MKDYSFGNFLRELRERRGLSQYQLGALVGVSNKAVSKWENGTAKPKTPILFRLSEILGVTVDELLACRYHSSDTDRKGMFAMKKEIWNKVSAAFRERYGDRPPLAAVNRLESEKAELEPTDFIVYLDLLAKITKTAKASGHHVELHDGTGGFFTAYLLGATDLNPLPPHYFCPICRKVEFVPDAADGWDLPAKTCACGSQMQRDGHNFPFEAYRSFYHRIKLSVMVDSGFFSEAEQIIREY
ncbi:MAG: helix-turn-helix domain-containing protein, partial [Eubacteriales bacterium]